MKILYLIMAHKTPGQVARLVQALTYPGAEFFIHIDGKQEVRPFAQALSTAGSSVQFIPDRVHMVGRPPGTSFSQVMAVLNSLSHTAERRRGFDYVVLLSGQDYPIKPNEEIHAFFERHRGKEFLEQFPTPPDALPARLKRIEQYHVEELLGRFYVRGLNSALNLVLPRKEFPKGLRPYWGSVYWRLTQPCAQYIVHFAQRNLRFIRFFRFANCPDEYVFHTIILNSSFAAQVVDDNLTYMDWPGTYHPKVLTTAHFSLLAESTKLFARKFDLSVDSHVLDLVDSRLLKGGSLPH